MRNGAETAAARRPSVWADVSSSDGLSLVEAAMRLPIDYLIARPDQLGQVDLPPRMRTVCAIGDGALDGVSALTDHVVVDPARIEQARAAGLRVATSVAVEDAESFDRCRAIAHEADVVLLRFTDDTNIPLELFIAEHQRDGKEIVKVVGSADDAFVSLSVLESGPSGVLFPVDALDAVEPVREYLERSERTEVPLVEACVTANRSIGVGYRACVDTVSMLGPDDGMVVGSTSSGGLMLCAEVHYLPYMNLRPFRVNAGGVHSYVWGPERAEYLTDLAAGSRVLAVSTSGAAWPVVVGRVKIEVRPLRLIEAVADGTRLNVFVQDDWHVRLFDGAGKPRNCTEVRAGDGLLAYVTDPGRHVGIAVEETIDER